MLHTAYKQLLFLTLLQILWCQAREEEILHNPASSNRYTVKEEIQKAPAENHVCKLTRTSVKISFPAMKSETFVNFLGYKEPNLVYLAR